MAKLTTQQRARRMLRNLHQIGLDYIALNGGGEKQKASYETSLRVLIGARAYRRAFAPR